MRTIPGVSALLVSVLLLVFALGCTQSPAPSPAPGASRGQAAATPAAPVKPLTVAIAGDIRGIDPHASELIIWGIIRNQVYEALLTLDPLTLRPTPRLATEWNWEDAQTLSLRLKDGVTFHSGVPFTAEDVKYSIERFLDEKTGAPRRARLASVDRVEVVDRLHARIVTKTPDAGLLGALGQVYMVPKGGGDTLQIEANGTGPFKLAEWQPNNHIRLVKNEHYWVPGQPAHDAITFRVMPQSETRVSSLIAGDIDVVADLDLKEVQRLQQQGMNVLLSPVGDYFWVAYFNQKQPYLKDRRVREALLSAFDRKTYVQAFQAGLAEVTNSPLSRHHWAYSKDVEGKFGYDPTRAAKLLAEAGYPGGQGLELTIIFPSGYPDFKAGSEMWQATLAELGVKVKVQELELAAWSSKVRSLDFDISWDIKDEGAGDPAILWGSNRAFVPGDSNYNGILVDTYPELTRLLDQAKQSIDQQQRADIYRQVQNMWVDEVMQAQIATKPVVFATRPGVSGFEPHSSIRYTDFRTATKR